MSSPPKKVVGSGEDRGVRQTHISELPVAVLTSIFGLVCDPRTRNRMSLACRDWYYLERQTRSSLTLKGNVWNLPTVPLSFASVTCLDLSYCSPWGYSIFQSTSSGETIARTLQEAFPNVKDLAVYVRDVVDVRTVVWLWPDLEAIRLVRWHQRLTEEGAGGGKISEVEPLLGCKKLRKIDLSEFYCWNEDILPALESGNATASNLRVLNLLKLSVEGFTTQEILDITAVCSNLEEFFVLCEFDPRFIDSVGDRALESIASNCPGLRVLHLADKKEWGVACCQRVEGPGQEDATVSCQGLETMSRNLPLLQSLALLLSQNVWDSRPGVEALFRNCRKLTSLQLSCFHGLCSGAEDGLATGSSLIELSIKRSVDLTDRSLAAIANGCKKLKKLSLKCCNDLSEEGLLSCARALSHTLVDVGIVCCKGLPSVQTLRGLEPIRSSIQRLQLDCIWDDAVVAQQAAAVAAGNRASTGLQAEHSEDDFLGPQTAEQGTGGHLWQNDIRGKWASSTPGKVQMLDTLKGRAAAGNFAHHVSIIGEASGSSRDTEDASSASNVDDPHGGDREEQSPDQRCWESLQALSLWMDVGFLMSPLPSMGLGLCPSLTDVTIKVEGDCKPLRRPAIQDWGLGALSRYTKFTKLTLDLGEVVSFSLSAPEGQTDLGIWERHYLTGISQLQLRDLDYRPPYDKHLNRRGLSLPAVGHLSQCARMRKLIVHGSAHAHFLSMLLGNRTLRDFQLRWDYYPAPEDESTTETRVDACRRFEETLVERGLSD